MSPIEFSGDDLLINGVSAKELVSGLRAAGLSEDGVTELLGKAIAQVPIQGAEALTAPFQFQTDIAETAQECAATYTRNFVHPDFFDGLTVVQAGTTPEELGFNFRFHAIEDDLDVIASDLHKLSNCVAELRRELFGLARELEAKITEIEIQLQAKGKEKEKDIKEKDKEKEKETKEGKDKESKEGQKEHKDKDHEKALPIEKAQPVENLPAQTPPGPDEEAPPTTGGARAFIRPEERPAVGERALRAAGDG